MSRRGFNFSLASIRRDQRRFEAWSEDRFRRARAEAPDAPPAVPPPCEESGIRINNCPCDACIARRAEGGVS